MPETIGYCSSAITIAFVASSTRRYRTYSKFIKGIVRLIKTR
jgi:hypothetical protein